VRRFHHVIAVSEHDKKLMSAWVAPEAGERGGPRVWIRRSFPRGPPAVEEALGRCFVGRRWDWEPNVDAVQVFLCGGVGRASWPRFPERNAFSNCGAEIRGRRVQTLASDSVEVTGSVSLCGRAIFARAAVGGGSVARGGWERA